MLQHRYLVDISYQQIIEVFMWSGKTKNVTVGTTGEGCLFYHSFSVPRYVDCVANTLTFSLNLNTGKIKKIQIICTMVMVFKKRVHTYVLAASVLSVFELSPILRSTARYSLDLHLHWNLKVWLWRFKFKHSHMTPTSELWDFSPKH